LSSLHKIRKYGKEIGEKSGKIGIDTASAPYMLFHVAIFLHQESLQVVKLLNFVLFMKIFPDFMKNTS